MEMNLNIHSTKILTGLDRQMLKFGSLQGMSDYMRCNTLFENPALVKVWRMSMLYHIDADSMAVSDNDDEEDDIYGEQS